MNSAPKMQIFGALLFFLQGIFPLLWKLKKQMR